MKRPLVFVLLPWLAACSSTPQITSYLTPYRIDVRQGNLVTQDMVTQLKPGLTRDQVRFLLGTPLVVDPFHSDRWDYVYRFQPGRGEAQQRRLIVYFEEGKLARVAGDVVAETGGAAVEAPAKPASRVVEIPGPGDAASK
jgi:outer membrane protein assembly factor BamE